MRLRLVLIYVLIAFSTTSIIKSEDENSSFNESANSEDNTIIKKDLNKNKTHLVVVGDTLSSIARIYSTTLESLIKANNLSDQNFIYIGQKLVIPEKNFIDLNYTDIDPTKFHEVKSGETLTDISILYGIEIDELIKINKIENENSINIGTRILLEKINTENEISIQENKSDKNFLNQYGPLQIISKRIEIKNNREILNAVNKDGENIIISLNCKTEEIDVRAKGRQWKGWLPAKQQFEKNILNDFCQKIIN